MARTSNTPDIEITDPVEAVRQKYDNILTLVIIVLGVGFVTLLITVIGLVIDAWNTKTLYFQTFQSQQQLSTQEQQLLQKLDAMSPSTTTKR